MTSLEVIEKRGSALTAGTQSIRRSMMILRCVASLRRSHANLPAIVKATGLNRSTAFRLLQCLVEEGMLSYDSTAKIYRIGRLAVELGLAGDDLDMLAMQWREPLARMARELELTAYLIVRSGMEAVCLACEQADTVLRAVPLSPGHRLPLGIGAGSLAILSSLDDADIARILDANRARLRSAPVRAVDDEQMWQRIAATRNAGFAYSAQTVSNGIVGIGITLPSDSGIIDLAASVSKVGDSLAIDEQKRLAVAMRKILLARLPAGEGLA